jgi:BirA family biotin operon repressor/biotin-[acetyl-CoA-carboxylase] ligase
MTPQSPPRVQHHTTLDSTNAEAMRLAAAGETGPLWILAVVQTAGRGRAGRSWVSEPGNLQASLLTVLSPASPKAYQLSLVAGVAVFDAIGAAMAPPPEGLRLKWPNDVYIGAEKAGGILIESSAVSAGLAAVIGIGVNLVTRPEVLARPVTCLAAHGAAPSPEALLAHIAAAMGHWLAVWAEGRGFSAIREAWLIRAHPIGERMSINTGAETVTGAFSGIDDDGALVLELTGGGSRRFTFGDVSLAR